MRCERMRRRVASKHREPAWPVATKTSIRQANSSRTTRSRRCRTATRLELDVGEASGAARGRPRRAAAPRQARAVGARRLSHARCRRARCSTSARPRTSGSGSPSYTRPTGHDTRIERVIAATAAVEFVTTATETEALLLEANLIKRLRPRFNVLLRDDKSFPYIIITVGPLGAADPQAPRRALAQGQLLRAVRLGVGGQPHHHGAAARVPAALLLGRLFREPHAAVPAAPDQALLGALHPGDRFRRICRAGARGQRLPLRQEPGGARRAVRRDGEGLDRARFRARRDLPRPARRAVGDAVDAGHQSAQRPRRPTCSPSIRRAASAASRCSSSAPGRTGATAPISRRPTARSVRARCWARSSRSSTTTSRARR